MRILHVITNLEVAGAERLLVNSLSAFRRMHPGLEHIVATTHRQGSLAGELPAGCTYFHLGAGSVNLISRILRLRRLINRHRINIVHAHLFEAMIIARLARPKHCKLVATYHTAIHDKQSMDYSRWRNLLDRATVNRQDASVFVTAHAERIVCRSLPGLRNPLVIPNYAAGSFRPLYRHRNDGSLRLVTVGNLRDQKNHLFAVRALGQATGLPVSLDIIGEGHLRAGLQREIDRSGARVRLLGELAVTSDLLANYDMFMMCSTHEGFPLSLIEAMVTGLPALLNDLPEFREVAGEAALFYADADQASFIAALQSCLDDRSRLSTLSGRSLTVAQAYTEEKYINSLYALYMKLGHGR